MASKASIFLKKTGASTYSVERTPVVDDPVPAQRTQRAHGDNPDRLAAEDERDPIFLKGVLQEYEVPVHLLPVGPGGVGAILESRVEEEDTLTHIARQAVEARLGSTKPLSAALPELQRSDLDVDAILLGTRPNIPTSTSDFLLTTRTWWSLTSGGREASRRTCPCTRSDPTRTLSHSTQVRRIEEGEEITDTFQVKIPVTFLVTARAERPRRDRAHVQRGGPTPSRHPSRARVVHTLQCPPPSVRIQAPQTW